MKPTAGSSLNPDFHASPVSLDPAGDAVFFHGKPLYSAQGQRSAERRASLLPLLPECLYFLPSPLLGFGLNTLLDRLPSNSHLLCIEIDQELMTLTHRISPAILQHPQLSIYRLDKEQDLLELLESLGLQRFRKTSLISLNRGYSLYRESYNRLFHFTEKTLSRYWSNKATLMKMGFLWIRNLLVNLAEIDPRKTRPLPTTDKPVIVAGAGESLEDCFSLLEENRSKYFLLAADTALQPLIRQGWPPDAVVALEAQFYNLDDFIPFSHNFTLISDLTGYPGILRHHQGPRAYIRTRYAPLSLWNRIPGKKLIPEVPPTGSVGILAAYLGLRMTKKEVFAYGLDFCYRPGKTHARGTPQHARLLRSLKRNSGLPFQPPTQGLRHRKNIEGNAVWSQPVMEGYRGMLEDLEEASSRLSLPSGKGLPGTREFSGRKKDVMDLSLFPSPPAKPFPGRQEWLFDEKNRMDCLEKNLMAIISGKNEDSEDLTEKLKEMDYLYRHFPDRELPGTTPGFYKRVLVELKRLREYLEQSILV